MQEGAQIYVRQVITLASEKALRPSSSIPGAVHRLQHHPDWPPQPPDRSSSCPGALNAPQPPRSSPFHARRSCSVAAVALPTRHPRQRRHAASSQRPTASGHPPSAAASSPLPAARCPRDVASDRGQHSGPAGDPGSVRSVAPPRPSCMNIVAQRHAREGSNFPLAWSHHVSLTTVALLICPPAVWAQLMLLFLAVFASTALDAHALASQTTPAARGQGPWWQWPLSQIAHDGQRVRVQNCNTKT